MNCYCCSGREFEDCCQPFIEGTKKPSTAEELMRSRFSAYATCEVDYLVRSTHPATRKFHDAAALRRWASENEWQKLEIIATDQGTAADKHGTVEFKADYTDADHRPQTHHEKSSFRKELGKWFFVDGKVL